MVTPVKDFSGGILDSGKGCLVTADLRAGKRWIGVGTAWSGIASWVFFYECPPWGAITIWVVIIWPTFNGMAYTYLVNY